MVIGEYVILLNNYINKKQKKKKEKICSTLKVRKVKKNQKQKDMYKKIKLYYHKLEKRKTVKLINLKADFL